MPMSRSDITMTGVCSRSARSNAVTASSKHSRGSRGNNSTCFVSPCDAYAAAKQIGLLRARRHSRRRADALHVEQHGGQLREVREAQELAHQRQAGAARRRERARAVPRGAEHDADRGELVLGLHDAVAPLAGLRILAIALAERLERVHQRRRRRDRVPRADRRARIQAAERRGRVAVDHDVAGRLVQRLHALRQRAGEIRARVVEAEIDGLLVRLDERRLAARTSP